MSPPIPDTESICKCSYCSYASNVNTFPKGRSFAHLKKCQTCNERDKARAKKKRDSNASNSQKKVTKGPEEEHIPEIRIDWDAFIEKISQAKAKDINCSYIVNLEHLCFELMLDVEEQMEESELDMNPEKGAEMERLELGKVAAIKKANKSQTNDAIKTLQFFCAQFDAEQAKSKLHADVSKQRSRDKMQRYSCGGWLNITMMEGAPEQARVRLIHSVHPGYVCISISAAEQKIIENMKHHSPSKACYLFSIDRMTLVIITIQIWDHILERNPDTELTEKQIQAKWTRVNKKNWLLDDNQVKSALLLLQRAEKEKTEVIPITQRNGASSIAFAFTEIVDSYIQGKTNALGYELLAIVGELNGQAIPLAFQLNTLTDTADEGVKELLLRDFIRWLAKRCPNIKFTLSDKDVTEINTFRLEIPHAKHRLCYWHGIRYIEKRLGPPAAFKDMMDTARSSQGAHPKLAKNFKRILHDVEKVGGAIGREKRRKTMPLTYKDGDSITMYMD
ncbi:hypothetical protein D9757_003048 [Collybiopsis confluens]|uniref:MULE transposase domain-containing protein n=1 Tax=Collybiopsis confluens TaxID=2823264 RepID=A0A8H5MEQ0_9AGAR|nr:hypothetical protein D9757_003048 [Collybiopsis confluens]